MDALLLHLLMQPIKLSAFYGLLIRWMCEVDPTDNNYVASDMPRSWIQFFMRAFLIITALDVKKHFNFQSNLKLSFVSSIQNVSAVT